MSCPNVQTIIFICNRRLGMSFDIGDLKKKWKNNALKTVFDVGRRELALVQEQGKFKGVEMKVMEWR